MYIYNINNNLGIVKFTVEGFIGQRSFQKMNLFIFHSLTPIITDGKTFLFIKIRLNYIFLYNILLIWVKGNSSRKSYNCGEVKVPKLGENEKKKLGRQ